MKSLATQIIIILLPIILFIIVFYISALALSKEREGSEISFYVSRIINEAETLKLQIIEKAKQERKNFNYRAQYSQFEVFVKELDSNTLEVYVEVTPIEKFYDIEIVLTFSTILKI